MKGREYQKFAMRTNDGKSAIRLNEANVRYAQLHDTTLDMGQLFNATLGLSGEVGEFNDLLKKILFHEAPFEIGHLRRELGDILWYIALICDTFEWSMDEIMKINLYKLQERYPISFDVDRSNNRKEGDI